MMKMIWKNLGLVAFCSAMIIARPSDIRADEISGPGLKYGDYLVTVDVDDIVVSKDEEGQEPLVTVGQGTSFELIEDMGNGTVKVKIGDTYGFLPVDGVATITPTDESTLDALNTKNGSLIPSGVRQNVVDYSLQFLGGHYVYGGSDPRTGVDCSGFTKYVMEHAAGISLVHSSSGQASQGRVIGVDEMRPGDLLFYGGGRSISHVAMYIGDEQVIHASTARTGIKISPWNYKTPTKIVDVLGD